MTIGLDCRLIIVAKGVEAVTCIAVEAESDCCVSIFDNVELLLIDVGQNDPSMIT